MLNFELDGEQKMLVEAVERFANSEIQKIYRDADEDGEIPEAVVQGGWEFGLLPTAIPEHYGGFGEYSTLTGVLALEAFSQGDLAIALNIAAPGLVAVPVMLAGTEGQKENYLPRFCTEKPPALTAALTEPHIQFDPRNPATQATRTADKFILNGVKRMVPLAATADEILVYAKEEDKTQAFFVERDNTGLEIGPREKLMGIRSFPTYGLTLTDCEVPLENKLGGDEGLDFDVILNHSRVALGALAIGQAKASYEYSREYAKNRVQFDEPIGHRQSIAFMLAEMAIDVDAGRLMVWEVAWKLDQGKDVTRDATVMKHFVDQMVLKVADEAVQTLGGYGFIREYPAELWLRNARGFASFDGLAIV